jgi:methionyl-tRNA formyltransferase
MNIIFLTSDAYHHNYLINKLHKNHPIKKVFYQTSHLERTSTKNRIKKLFNPKTTRFAVRRAISTTLFLNDISAQKPYERNTFFGESKPGLNDKIPSEKVFNFNDPVIVEKVKAEEPDLIIVFGTDILKGEILEIAKLNILNIHRDILPKYRGGGLPYWVFYNKDFDNLGVTVHICAKKLDGGHIVGQKKYKLTKDDKIFTLRHKTTDLAAEILEDVIEKYKANTVEFTKQKKTKLWTQKRLTIGKEIKARLNFRKYIKSLKEEEV